MSDAGQEFWDLSDNDVAALKALLADWKLLREFERLVREESRPEAIHWLDEQRKVKRWRRHKKLERRLSMCHQYNSE